MMPQQSMDRCEVSENYHHHSPGVQGSQRRLVSGLLLWVGLLTVSHVVSITLLVITRPHALSITLEPQRVPWQMLTFEPTSIDDNDVSVARSGIKWKTQSKANNFVSLKGGSLTINQDGCYFLYLQVTLETPEVSGQHIVRVNKPNSVLLEVRMNNTSLSTGFLGRAVDLAASDTLTVTVSPGARINTTYTATYLGIIGPKLYL
uniref:TNF superfamily member 18 n=1 Tax=Oncorhynchus kisutch TaxID=8019 RepID=A0A8C7J106_ONCKI